MIRLLIRESIGIFLETLVVSVLATSLAVASVFGFYRYVRKPSAVLMFMNTAASMAFVYLGAIVLIEHHKMLLCYLFFVAYFYVYNSLGRHITRYDDTFRMLFLSMGYTRQEFFKKYLLVQGKWKLVDTNFSFATMTTLIIVFSREIKYFFPDQWLGLMTLFMASTFVITLSRWLGDDYGNKLSKGE